MNRKGFTLIELLATIVILGIVGGIATYGVISAINNSKLKSEKIFVDKISNLIDDYLALYPPSEIIGKEYTFNKCKDASCSESYPVTVTQVAETYNPYKARALLDSVLISDLVNEKMVTYADLINPKNKKQCFSADYMNDPEIIVYKDSDYVYHYYVDLSYNTCDISYENILIDNMPENLVKTLITAQNNGDYIYLSDILKEKYN